MTFAGKELERPALPMKNRISGVLDVADHRARLELAGETSRCFPVPSTRSAGVGRAAGEQALKIKLAVSIDALGAFQGQIDPVPCVRSK